MDKKDIEILFKQVLKNDNRTEIEKFCNDHWDVCARYIWELKEYQSDNFLDVFMNHKHNSKDNYFIKICEASLLHLNSWTDKTLLTWLKNHSDSILKVVISFNMAKNSNIDFSPLIEKTIYDLSISQYIKNRKEIMSMSEIDIENRGAFDYKNRLLEFFTATSHLYVEKFKQKDSELFFNILNKPLKERNELCSNPLNFSQEIYFRKSYDTGSSKEMNNDALDFFLNYKDIILKPVQTHLHGIPKTQDVFEYILTESCRAARSSWYFVAPLKNMLHELTPEQQHIYVCLAFTELYINFDDCNGHTINKKSHFSSEEIIDFLSVAPIDLLQQTFSLTRPQINPKTIPLIEKLILNKKLQEQLPEYAYRKKNKKI